jgi:hypothetical protein
LHYRIIQNYISVDHTYDSESDYFEVKRVSNDLLSIMAAEIDVEFDGVIMVE